MFGMFSNEIPYRNKNNLARAQQFRGLTRRRTGPASTTFDDMWMPFMDRDSWQRDFVTGRVSSVPNRIEEIFDSALPRSMSSNDIGYGGSYAKESGQRGAYTGQRLSFGKAAANLFNAVDRTLKYCEPFEQAFINDTYDIGLWAAPKIMDVLWAMKIDWNGVPAFESAKNPNLKPKTEQAYYRKYAMKLMQAWEDMSSCGPLPRGAMDGPGAKLGPVEVMTTMKKLQATFQGIEELIMMVRTDRNRMRSLVIQLRDARNALTDLESVWNAPMRTESEHRPNGDGETYY